MFPLAKKNKKHEEAAFPVFDDDDVARLAAREDGAIIYASPAFHNLYGSSVLDQGQTIHSLLNLRGEIAPGIYKIRIPGNAQTVDFHFDWLMSGQGRYLIGSRIESEAAKSVPQGDLEKFFEMSQDIMLTTSSNHEILRANGVFEALHGRSLGESAALNFIDLFHPEDRPYIRNTIKAMNMDTKLDLSACSDFEARLMTASGDERWVEWRQCVAGDLIYYTGRDVTSLKSQRHALDKRQTQLQQAESIGRLGHWHWTLGNDIFEWSDELYRIFGVSRSFQPSLESLAQLIHKRDMPRINQAFQRAVIEENDYDMEFRMIHPDGDTRYMRCEGRCQVNEAGEIVALYGIMQDMTERMLYERDLKAAKEGAERANAAKSQFLANMSHELRTPLNAIIGFSEVILKQLLGPVGSEKYLEYMEGIHQSGEHLLDLISDILDMSKMEAGKYELDVETVNVAKTIRMAVHMIEGKALDASLKITLDETMGESVQIIADRRALLQVMLNLLSNAVKFTKPGGWINVDLQQKNDFIIIKVADNGIGIPANKLASITKPFEQVFSHYTRQHEGSGLGLAITKELVEMHGGSLGIESALDMGTSVTVRLPVTVRVKT